MTATTGASREHIERILEIVMETERDGLLTDRREDGLSGISGLKTVGLIQRLAKRFAAEADACYLEIGVFQGLTLVSTALEAPDMPCFGIDNFTTLDPKGENKIIATERLDRFGATNATLIDNDFEAALRKLEGPLGGRKIAVYFVDGPHDYRSQMVCLLLAKRHLHARAVIVIDDANYTFVRQSTADFLAGHPDFKMIFEAYSPAHPFNMTPEEKEIHESGWLNGVNVLVRDPDGLLPDMAPPTGTERTLYSNEWLVHRMAMAELAPESVRLAEAVCSGDADAEREALDALLKRQAALGDTLGGRFAERNTYSAGLTQARFNELSR